MKPKAKPQTDAILVGTTVAAWARWLGAHHERSDGVWLQLTKKSVKKSLTYAEALEVALCWGWIDSQKRALDETAWQQRFTRRTAKSPWSKINRAKAEALIAAGSMHPPGLVEVERAKADGRWDRAYDGPKTMTLPDDLAAALAKRPGARAFFDDLDSANRYAILHRVQTAKKPETRNNHIERLSDLCARRDVLHPERVRKRPKA